MVTWSLAVVKANSNASGVRVAHTIDHQILISATTMAEPLEFPNPRELASKPASKSEKEQVVKWLRVAFNR
jgi:hypothetical protein